jgi:hypothetical protein
MSPSGAFASADAIAGPLEQQYLDRSAAFRDASDASRVTRTHWHIAIANGLGWGFGGMDGVIFALATPLVIKDFGVTDCRSHCWSASCRPLWQAHLAGDQHRAVLAADADRGTDHDIRRLRRRAQRDQLRIERRMVTGVDAGGRPGRRICAAG